MSMFGKKKSPCADLKGYRKTQCEGREKSEMGRKSGRSDMEDGLAAVAKAARGEGFFEKFKKLLGSKKKKK